MDPCGMVVEIGRLPYTTEIRPFRDDDRTVRIVWYPATEGAKPLPFPTAIISRVWQADRHDGWAGRPPYPDRLGEVIGADRPITWQKTKHEATGQRWCGTAADFLLGCEFTTDDPVVRRDDGLPMCCGQALIPQGGIGVGGEAEMGVDDGDWGEVYRVVEAGQEMDRVEPKKWNNFPTFPRFILSTFAPLDGSGAWNLGWAVSGTGNYYAASWDGQGSKTFVHINGGFWNGYASLTVQKVS